MTRFVLVSILAALALQLPPNALAQAKRDKSQPVIAGTTQGNTGCAILEKHTPIKGKLLLVGVFYARTQYRVLKTFDCKLPKQKYTGAGEIKQLNQFAAKNKIKLVVIPSSYADEQMESAEKACGQPSSPTSSHGTPGN